MLQTKIYASNVGNLSDARYFAARGVDYIGFLLNSDIPTASIKEMMDWVEGPTYIGEIATLDSTPAIIESTIELDIQKVSTGPFFNGYIPPSLLQISTHIYPDFNKNQEEAILKIDVPFEKLIIDELSAVSQYCSQGQIWLDLEYDVAHVLEVIKSINPYGLIIRGGDEEKVGLKNFEDLDEIFDLIEVFD